MKNESEKIKWPLLGNEKITKFLTKSILNNNISNAYIFTGPDNLGKTRIAIHFAQILTCKVNNEQSELPCGKCDSCRKFDLIFDQNKKLEKGENDNIDNYLIHGDFHLLKKNADKKSITIDQIREFIRVMNLSSFLNSKKIGIIKHADIMTNESSNALLKTLEEPKSNSVIILITSHPEKLPATIISRCQVLRFNLVNYDLIHDYLVDEKNISRSKAKNFAHLSAGRPALAVKFFEKKDFQDKYMEWLEAFIWILSTVDLNERLETFDSVIGKKDAGQFGLNIAKRNLEIWAGFLRDLYLESLGHSNLLQHVVKKGDINKLKNKFGYKKILILLNMIDEAYKNLEVNISPKLALENLIINI